MSGRVCTNLLFGERLDSRARASFFFFFFLGGGGGGGGGGGVSMWGY